MRRGSAPAAATFAFDVCVLELEAVREPGKTYCVVARASGGGFVGVPREARTATIDTRTATRFPRAVVRVQVQDTIYDRVAIRVFRYDALVLRIERALSDAAQQAQARRRSAARRCQHSSCGRVDARRGAARALGLVAAAQAQSGTPRRATV